MEKEEIKKISGEILTEKTANGIEKSNQENVIADKKVKKKIKKIYEFDSLQDIKFRGPLSYRHLRIFAWLFFIASQIGFVLSVYSKLDPVWGDGREFLTDGLSLLGGLTFPLFLLAAFAIILNVKDGYKKLITFYAICAGLFCVGFIVVYYHYAVGFLKSLTGDAELSKETAASVIRQLSKGGYLSINIFIDLLLCALFMCFINYRPKKYFQGKKLKWFRLLAIIPVLYEAVSVFLKIESIFGNIILPIPVYPLLTTKPPVTFLFFICLAFFIKKRERVFVKRGNKSFGEYKQFLKSNANSLHFSLFTSLSIIITAVIDVILLFGLAAIMFAVSPETAVIMENTEIATEIVTGKFTSYVSLLYGLGIGKSFMLIFAVPFVLLFSYTKTHKNASVDRAIPLIGTGVVAFIYFEGIFQLLKLLPNILG